MAWCLKHRIHFEKPCCNKVIFTNCLGRWRYSCHPLFSGTSVTTNLAINFNIPPKQRKWQLLFMCIIILSMAGCSWDPIQILMERKVRSFLWSELSARDAWGWTVLLGGPKELAVPLKKQAGKCALSRGHLPRTQEVLEYTKATETIPALKNVTVNRKDFLI